MTLGLDITEIGAELVQVAGEWERSPGDILGELFPYVFEASRKMSTRAISRWLKEQHGVQISQPTISRALRNPEKYWPAFAEMIEPHARIVEDGVEVSLQDFLFDEAVFQWMLRDKLSLRGETQEALARHLADVESAASLLRDRWFCLSPETRECVRPYLKDMEEEE